MGEASCSHGCSRIVIEKKASRSQVPEPCRRKAVHWRTPKASVYRSWLCWVSGRLGLGIEMKRCRTQSQYIPNSSDIHQKWAIALRGLCFALVKTKLCFMAREDQARPIKSLSLMQDGTIPSFHVMSTLQMMCANATGACLTRKMN